VSPLADDSKLARLLQKKVVAKPMSGVVKMKNPRIHKMDKQLYQIMKIVRYLDPNQIKKRARSKLRTDIRSGIKPSKTLGFEISKRIAWVIIKKLKIVKHHVEERVKIRGH
jgi:hypothetical protein